MDTLSSTKEARIYNGKKTTSLTSGAGKTSQPLVTEWDDLREHIESCILSSVKQITSPGWMHETIARGWCTGMTQRNGMGKEVGGGIRMGNTCNYMADSCQCMARTTTIL